MNNKSLWLAKVSQLVSLLFQVLQLSRDESEAVMTSVKSTRDKASDEQDKKDVSKYGHTYLDSINRRQNEYLLPRFETEILITGYDVMRRAAVIHRWFELESGKATPHCPTQRTPVAS